MDKELFRRSLIRGNTDTGNGVIIPSSTHNALCAVTVFEREKKREEARRPRLLPLGSFPGSCLEIEVANHDASFSF